MELTAVRELVTIVKEVVTVVAILVGGVWAILKFKLFRVISPNVNIEVKSRHVWRADHLVLYTNVEILNIGTVEIVGRYCSLEVEWLLGAEPYTEHQGEQAVHLDDDPKHYYLIDKGEHSRFVFITVLHLQPSGERPTAYRIRVVYASKKRLENDEPLCWMREDLHLLTD